MVFWMRARLSWNALSPIPFGWASSSTEATSVNTVPRNATTVGFSRRDEVKTRMMTARVPSMREPAV